MLSYSGLLMVGIVWYRVNPLPHMPILGSSNSAANEKNDVKNVDKWGCSFLIEEKTFWEKKKLLATSSFFISHNVFKSCQLLMR